MEYIKVENWESYQQYKDRTPPWIKLYNSLLDDYDFSYLPDASKWHMVGIFLLASRYNNKIPNDAEWLATKLSSKTPVDIPILVSSGMIGLYHDDSTPLAECLSRVEESRVEKRRKEESREELLAEFGEFCSHFTEKTGRAVREKTDKRVSAFKARREVWSLEEMKKAVVNASKDKQLCGANDKGKNYLTIDYILRSDRLEYYALDGSTGEIPGQQPKYWEAPWAKEEAAEAAARDKFYTLRDQHGVDHPEVVALGKELGIEP